MAAHARKLFHAAQGSYTIMQKLSNKQSAKVICRFDLEHHTARDRKAIRALKSYRPPMHLITYCSGLTMA